MTEPEFNTYQITLTVEDVAKADATALADSVRFLAECTKTKSQYGRHHKDVSVTVAHVKLSTNGEL